MAPSEIARVQARSAQGVAPSRALPVGALRRLRRDPYILLTLAMLVPLLIVAMIRGTEIIELAILAAAVALSAQVLLTAFAPIGRTGRSSTWWSVLRLVVCLVFAFAATQITATGGTRPLLSLFIPVVVLAAAMGAVEALVIGGLAIPAYFLTVVLTPGANNDVISRGLPLAAVCIILALGTRRTVSTLERALASFRAAIGRERQRTRQVEAIVGVSEALAAKGPEDAVVERVVDVLQRTFGYRYVSLFMVEANVAKPGAQRGYAGPMGTFASDRGVIGRVMRSREPAWIADVTSDPDYISGDPAVTGEACLPLLADAELLGILNVETTRDRPLEPTDFGALKVVADRLAAGLSVGRNRQSLTERAELLRRLNLASAMVDATVDPVEAYQTVVRSISSVVDVDAVAILEREPGGTDSRIVASSGLDDGDETLEDQVITLVPGWGLGGRAIATGRVAVSDDVQGETGIGSLLMNHRPSASRAAAAPLVRDRGVIGAMVVLRDRPTSFSPNEIEILGLLGAQVALALANIELHQALVQQSIHDSLTGCYNRRYLDEALRRIEASRRRQDPADRLPITAILFDLDHFGDVNNRQGHQVGDMVLRRFGEILRARFRASDLVARYGGEEFVVILEGASREDAVRIAEEVRLALSVEPFVDAGGGPLRQTVSAGCAALESDEVASLLSVLDVALQMAKRSGRNAVVAA